MTTLLSSSSINLFQLPALLIAIIFSLGSGIDVHMPLNKPLGVVNTVGICYYASAKQLLDAALYALDGKITPILEHQSEDLVQAYLATRSDYAQFYGHSCVNADRFIKEWVDVNPERYKCAHIIKSIRAHDGSVSSVELFPHKIGTGCSGTVIEVINEILEDFHTRCTKLKVTNPFLTTSHTQKIKASKPDKPATMLRQVIMYQTGDHHDTAAQSLPQLVGTKLECTEYITTGPRILSMVPSDNTTQHELPVNLELQDPAGCKGHYRLLGAAYGQPIIDERKGFDCNHAIAIVRYDNNWYKCDNHEIFNFAHESAVVDWIRTEAATSYEGSGMPEHALRGAVPFVALYEFMHA